jgi:hypothetical protein
MRWIATALSLVALLTSGMPPPRIHVGTSLTLPAVSCQDEFSTFKYCDAEKRCYSAYKNDDGITYAIAIPPNPQEKFEVIVQITTPASIGWAGLAWGGGMTYNPLAIVWRNGDKPMISSRMAL